LRSEALTRILHDGWRHAISAASAPARRAGSTRPSISCYFTTHLALEPPEGENPTSTLFLFSRPFTQIGFNHLWIAPYLFRSSLTDPYTVIKDVDSLANAHHNTHVVFNEQHRDIKGLLHEFYQSHQIAFLRWSHPRSRFVQQKQFRRSRQSADYLKPSLVAVGK